jgi:uncharacterized protein (TIGR04255 family)
MQRMTTPSDYPRASVIETIIDFQVELAEEVKLPGLERCHDAAYPSKEKLNVPVPPVDFGRGDSTVMTSRHTGFLFASADKKQLFQARGDGFTVHRLAPYQGWEPFRDEARRLWDIYKQTARARKVTRAAVRCLNRLDLPSPVVEMKDYLRTSPEVSPDLPQGLAGFFMELSIPLEDIKSTLLLREKVVPPVEPGVVSVVLDIDLFRSDEIPTDDAGLWALIESFRTRKNEVFEACITNRVREVIQQWQAF